MRKEVLFYSILILASFAHSIIIVPPVVYFATLSLAAFISNSLIGLFALLAITGFAGKSFFGKRLSEILAFLFSSLGKGAIALASMLASALIINPVEFFSALQGALLSFFMCLILLMLSGYSELRLFSKEKRGKMIISSLSFCSVIFILFSISSLVSIETKIISGSPAESKEVMQGISDNLGSSGIQQREMQDISEPSYGIAPSQDAYSKPSEQPYEAKQSPAKGLWLYPESKEECIVSIGNQIFSFKPSENCYLLYDGVPKRISCPVKISIEEVSARGAVSLTASGSCKDSANIYVSDNGFGVE